MTAAGRLLQGAVEYGKRGGMAPALREVLAAYERLPREQRVPAEVPGEPEPVPAPPPGGAVLTIYDRPVARLPDGTFRLPQGNDLNGIRTHAQHGQRSSLWLTAEECRSLVPKDPKPGDTHAIAQNLTKRICLYGLWPQTLWVVEHQWQPNSLKNAELNLTVQEVTGDTVRMRIQGACLLSTRAGLKIYPTGKIAKQVENRFDARIEGVIECNRASGAITRWDMVALGDYTGAMFVTREVDGNRVGDDGWKEAAADAPMPLAFAFELDASAYSTAPERRRPRSFVHAYIFRDREAFYWDPAKWEEDWRRRQGQ